MNSQQPVRHSLNIEQRSGQVAAQHACSGHRELVNCSRIVGLE